MWLGILVENKKGEAANRFLNSFLKYLDYDCGLNFANRAIDHIVECKMLDSIVPAQSVCP